MIKFKELLVLITGDKKRAPEVRRPSVTDENASNVRYAVYNPSCASLDDVVNAMFAEELNAQRKRMFVGLLNEQRKRRN